MQVLEINLCKILSDLENVPTTLDICIMGKKRKNNLVYHSRVEGGGEKKQAQPPVKWFVLQKSMR